MRLSRDLQLRLHHGEISVAEAWRLQEVRDSGSGSPSGMVPAIGLVPGHVLASPAFASLVRACARRGIDLQGHDCTDRWRERFADARNVITWGMRLPQRDYADGRRNVLYLENGLLRQRTGMFIDAHGFFADSGLCRYSEWRRVRSAELVRQVTDHIRHEFGCDLFAGGDPAGPVLVPLQLPEDAPLRFYCQHQGDGLQYLIDAVACYLPAGPEVLLRPHPRHNFRPELYRIPAAWTIDRSPDVYATLRRCRALVTVNSTLAVEALALGIPVATLGRHVWTGSGVTLECDGCPERLQDLPTWHAVLPDAIGFLCAVWRHHLPKAASVDIVEGCPSFAMWADACRRAEAVPVSSLDVDYAAACQRLRSRLDPELWGLVDATDAALERCAEPCRRRKLLRVIDADRAAAGGRPPLFAGELADQLQSAGLQIHRPDLRGYRERLQAARDGHEGRLQAGPAITLGFLYQSHLGDALCTTPLARQIAETGSLVSVVRHRSTLAAFSGNPNVQGFATTGYLSLSPPGHDHGHVIQRVQRRLGLAELLYCRPELYPTQVETQAVKSLTVALPRPLVILSTSAVSNGDTYPRMPWARWASILIEHGASLVHCPRGDEPDIPGVLSLRDLPVRQWLALFSLADAYLGTWAAGSHAAAAHALEALIVCDPASGVRADHLSFPTPIVRVLTFLYPQHTYGFPAKEVLLPNPCTP